MSYIPPIREKIVFPLYANTKGSHDHNPENAYWQGFLNDEDMQTLIGYDFAVSCAVEDFFSNIDEYSDYIAKALELKHLNIDTSAICCEKEFADFSAEDLEVLSVETRILLALKDCLKDWLEMRRDELGVSMIDEMDSDEYDRIRSEVESGKRKTVYTEAES